MALRMGIDFGGTKIEHAVLGPDGAILLCDRTPTPPGYDEAVRALAALVPAIEAQTGPVTVGIGIPGVISAATGLVKNANSICLNGHALVSLSEEAGVFSFTIRRRAEDPA